ncbi:hypothetical protein Tco_0335070 [Tanacetum coccineum]
MTFDHNSSSLGRQRQWCLLKITLQAPFLNVQKTFDRSRSSLGLHGDDVSSHQFRPRSSSRQELELLFHHQIAMLRTTGINPMIQPEPEDLPKDNPKLEIAVLRMKKKCMDKGSKERSPPHNLRQKPGQYICCQNHKLIADIENDIMDPVMQCTTLLSHSGGNMLQPPSTKTKMHSSKHPSDTNVFTIKMEILLEPASNKLLVGNGYPEKDKKQSQKRQNWARNGIV